MTDYEFILAYKDMKPISVICDDLKINYSNLINGKSSKENEKKVADKLKIESYKIYSLLNMMEVKNVN